MSEAVSAGSPAAPTSLVTPSVRRKAKHYDLDFKQKFVNRAIEVGSVAAVCKEFGVAGHAVGYKWVANFKAQGLEGLNSKSTRPHHQPKKTSQWIVDKILGIKKDRPEMGSKAMSEHLERFDAVKLSSNTVSKVFKKNKLCDGDAGYAKNSFYAKGDDGKRLEQALEKDLGEWERFSRPHPNDLWQMDIMGFYIRDAHKVYLISALDDCSRMIVNWGLFSEQTADNVLEVLRVALAKHGAPKEVLTDQGAQFKHWKGVTQFEELLRKLNVEHIKARSHHPQTCGKIEAFHKTIHRELIDKEFFISQAQATQKIATFIEHYNYARPHSSIEGFTPSDKYFGVVGAVKKYLSDFQAPKNELEKSDKSIGIARGSKVYLVGKFLNQDIRIQELGGSISIHVNNSLMKEINLVGSIQNL